MSNNYLEHENKRDEKEFNNREHENKVEEKTANTRDT